MPVDGGQAQDRGLQIKNVAMKNKKTLPGAPRGRTLEQRVGHPRAIASARTAGISRALRRCDGGQLSVAV